MPTVYEKHESRPFVVDARAATLTREYVVTGTMSEDEVYELVRAASPVLHFYLVRKSIKADHQGGGIWFATVDYDAALSEQQAVTESEPEVPAEAPGADTPLGSNYSFDTSGQTVHITQSRSTRSMTLSTGAAAANNKRAIGLTKDEVKGCDIYAPGFQWTLEVQRRNCTLRYLKTLRDLTGSVNYDAAFYGFEAGTVLYLGASGKFTSRERWTITHKFAVSKTELNLVVSDDITVAEKQGWDYLWVGYTPNAVANQLLQKPVAAYVERVYPTGNFAQLEIGV